MDYKYIFINKKEFGNSRFKFQLFKRFKWIVIL